MAGSPSRPTATTTGKAVAPTSGGLFLRVAFHSGERWGDNPDQRARGACRRGWSVCFASSAFMASAAIRGSASMAHPVGARPRTLPRRHECIVPLPWAAWLAQTAQLMPPSRPALAIHTLPHRSCLNRAPNPAGGPFPRQDAVSTWTRFVAWFRRRRQSPCEWRGGPSRRWAGMEWNVQPHECLYERNSHSRSGILCNRSQWRAPGESSARGLIRARTG